MFSSQVGNGIVGRDGPLQGHSIFSGEKWGSKKDSLGIFH